MSVNKLRLGPLPKSEQVKLTITLSAKLRTTLDCYAALHAQTYGERVDAATLAPYMLEAFMARDRMFRKMGDKRIVPSIASEPPLPTA